MTKATGVISSTSEHIATARNISRHFLSITEFFQSFSIELKIRTHTQTLIPAKAFCTAGTSAKAVRNTAIRVIIIMEGVTAPSPAAIAPAVPFLL